MLSQKIIISKSSFKTADSHQIIDSNIQYITKLFQHNISDSNIYEDALKSYYIDYYLSHILHGGFSSFIEHITNKPKILFYIREGLNSIQAHNHLELLIHAIQINPETLQSFSLFNTLFSEYQEKENLVTLNALWIKAHPQILLIKEEDFDKKVQEHLKSIKAEKRHVKIIKELCSIANEEFIRVTAGDKNSLYHDGLWYFKTDKGSYYMIEKDHLVTMYDSETKESVVKGKIASTHSLSESYKSILTKLLN